MAKSIWMFGYLPDNFQLYISRETMKLEKKLWESICAGARIQPFGKPRLLLMFFSKNTSWNKSKNYLVNLLISRDFPQQFNTLLFQDTKAVLSSDRCPNSFSAWALKSRMMLSASGPSLYTGSQRFVSTRTLLNGSQLLLCIQEWFHA